MSELFDVKVHNICTYEVKELNLTDLTNNGKEHLADYWEIWEHNGDLEGLLFERIKLIGEEIRLQIKPNAYGYINYSHYGKYKDNDEIILAAIKAGIAAEDIDEGYKGKYNSFSSFLNDVFNLFSLPYIKATRLMNEMRKEIGASIRISGKHYFYLESYGE